MSTHDTWSWSVDPRVLKLSTTDMLELSFKWPSLLSFCIQCIGS